MVPAKLFMREIWLLKLDWDEKLPDEFIRYWCNRYEKNLLISMTLKFQDGQVFCRMQIFMSYMDMPMHLRKHMLLWYICVQFLKVSLWFIKFFYAEAREPDFLSLLNTCNLSLMSLVGLMTFFLRLFLQHEQNVESPGKSLTTRCW